MWIITNFLLCILAEAMAQDEVTLQAGRPYLRVKFNGSAALVCCYITSVEKMELTWLIHDQASNKMLAPKMLSSSDHVTKVRRSYSDQTCDILFFKSVQLNDTGLYRCFLRSQKVSLLSHGTYLQVSKVLESSKTLSENTRNKILTAEGIMLLLCVLLPATSFLCQSNRKNELEKKKMKKEEEENIYQGLNLDDCLAIYDQINRFPAHGPYQDVCNVEDQKEEIHLEKP